MVPWKRSQDRVVVRRAGRDAVMPDPLGRQGVDEGASDVFGPIVGQDRPDLDPVTAVETQRLVHEAGRYCAGGRAQHDGDDGEAGRQNPKGSSFRCASGTTSPVVAAAMAAARARRWARRPRPWATRCFCTVDLAMENPWSPSRCGAYWRLEGTSTSSAHCAGLQVSRSAYYAWARRRGPQHRPIVDGAARVNRSSNRTSSRRRYGVPRVTAAC